MSIPWPCVGMKSMRCSRLSASCGGEEDRHQIEFSEEITTFAEKALQPAKGEPLSITDLFGEKQLESLVDERSFHWPSARRGKCAPCRQAFLGWKIDIKSEEEQRQEVEQQMQGMGSGQITPMEGRLRVWRDDIQKLVAAGITTVESLAT